MLSSLFPSDPAPGRLWQQLHGEWHFDDIPNIVENTNIHLNKYLNKRNL